MTGHEGLEQEAHGFQESMQRVRDEVGKAIVGQQRLVECALTAIFSGGNVLLEGVPGLGKTELVKTLSRVLDLKFSRIQFTPDLMPADILGTNVLAGSDSGQSYRLEFRPGPVFTQLLLADEINRASPKTQSALLETMQEATVTVAGKTHQLEPPFFVLATQNPLEQEGTYALPEAQLDRFLFKVEVPSLDRDDLNEVVRRTILQEPRELEKVITGEQVLAMQATARKVVVADAVRDYAVRIVLATHGDSPFATDAVRSYVRWGASPRSAQALIKAGRIRALADGRAHVATEDVRWYAREVLQHRLILNYDGQAEDVKVPALIEELVGATPEEAA